MNIWERLMRVFVKPQKNAVEETLEILRKNEQEKAIKEPEEKPTLDVIVKGTYGIEVADGKYFCCHTLEHVDSKYISLKVKAEAQIYFDDEVVTLQMDKEERISEHYDLCYENSIVINFMKKTDEQKEEKIKKGIERMVKRTIEEEKYKSLKEQFKELKNVNLEIKITIPKDSIK